jgi:hypothetical protein
MFVLRFLFREKSVAEFVLPNVMALACKCCDIAAVFIWVIRTCSLICMMDVWRKNTVFAFGVAGCKEDDENEKRPKNEEA